MRGKRSPTILASKESHVLGLGVLFALGMQLHFFCYSDTLQARISRPYSERSGLFEDGGHPVGLGAILHAPVTEANQSWTKYVL